MDEPGNGPATPEPPKWAERVTMREGEVMYDEIQALRKRITALEGALYSCHIGNGVGREFLHTPDHCQWCALLTPPPSGNTGCSLDKKGQVQ